MDQREETFSTSSSYQKPPAVTAVGLISLLLNAGLTVMSFLFLLAWNLFVDFLTALFNLKAASPIHSFMNFVFITSGLLGIFGVFVSVSFLRRKAWARWLLLGLVLLHCVLTVLYVIYSYPQGLWFLIALVLVYTYCTIVIMQQNTRHWFQRKE